MHLSNYANYSKKPNIRLIGQPRKESLWIMKLFRLMSLQNTLDSLHLQGPVKWHIRWTVQVLEVLSSSLWTVRNAETEWCACSIISIFTILSLSESVNTVEKFSKFSAILHHLFQVKVNSLFESTIQIGASSIKSKLKITSGPSAKLGALTLY